jgi:ribosomal protein S18 acetylase RimI-like enzyme
MQQIRTLGDVPLTTIAAAVGHAFEDYFMKIDASPATLGTQWYGARVDYALSFGAFENDQLVAFLLHGIDDSKNGKKAHNIASGVLPAYRGKRLIEQIYEKALPVLRIAGIKTLTLEVITENQKAIKAYQNVGLRPAGMLRCFDGNLNVPDEKAFASFRVQKIQDYEWDLVKDLVSYTYSWDNQPDAVAMLADDYETWLVYDQQNVLNGFAVINPQNGYISQFGFRSGATTSVKMYLFKALSDVYPNIRVNNIPNDAEDIIDLLYQVGLNNTKNQFEMKMNLTANMTEALSMRVAAMR